jgi:hypothetical protein
MFRLKAEAKGTDHAEARQYVAESSGTLSDESTHRSAIRDPWFAVRGPCSGRVVGFAIVVDE